MTEHETRAALTRAVAARRRNPDADFIAHAPTDMEALARDSLRLRAACVKAAKIIARVEIDGDKPTTLELLANVGDGLLDAVEGG